MRDGLLTVPHGAPSAESLKGAPRPRKGWPEEERTDVRDNEGRETPVPVGAPRPRKGWPRRSALTCVTTKGRGP